MVYLAMFRNMFVLVRIVTQTVLGAHSLILVQNIFQRGDDIVFGNRTVRIDEHIRWFGLDETAFGRAGR